MNDRLLEMQAHFALLAGAKLNYYEKCIVSTRAYYAALYKLGLADGYRWPAPLPEFPPEPRAPSLIERLTSWWRSRWIFSA